MRLVDAAVIGGNTKEKFSGALIPEFPDSRILGPLHRLHDASLGQRWMEMPYDVDRNERKPAKGWILEASTSSRNHSYQQKPVVLWREDRRVSRADSDWRKYIGLAR